MARFRTLDVVGAERVDSWQGFVELVWGFLEMLVEVADAL